MLKFPCQGFLHQSIVHCKHPPWAIPCHPLVLRWCGWRLAGRPWCRGPCCSAPGPPHPSCCSCPAPAPLVTTNEVKIPALGTLLGCRCGWGPPRTDHSAHCRLLGGLLGHSALVRVKGAIVRAVTGHPWSLDVATTRAAPLLGAWLMSLLCTQAW